MNRYHRQVIATAAKWNEVAADPEARGHIHPGWWEGGDEGYASLGMRDAVAVMDAASLFLGDHKQWRVLDVGCGDGRVLLPMEFLGVGQGEHGVLVGLDTSAKMLDLLADNPALPESARVQTLQVLPGQEWPQVAPPFDVAYSFNLFIHLPSSEKLATLRRISNVLRWGGVAAVQLPLYIEVTEPLSWTGVGVWTRDRLWEAADEVGLTPHRLWAHPHRYEMGTPGEYHHVPQILLKKP